VPVNEKEMISADAGAQKHADRIDARNAERMRDPLVPWRDTEDDFSPISRPATGDEEYGNERA
jgi:hypothetical protein